MGTLDKSSSTLANENGLGLFSTGALAVGPAKGAIVVMAAVEELLVVAPEVGAVDPKVNGLLVTTGVFFLSSFLLSAPGAPNVNVGTDVAAAEVDVVVLGGFVDVPKLKVGAAAAADVVDVVVAAVVFEGPKVKPVAGTVDVAVEDAPKVKGLLEVVADFPVSAVEEAWVPAVFPKENVGAVAVVAMLVVAVTDVEVASVGLPNEKAGVAVVGVDSAGFPKVKAELEAGLVVSVDVPNAKAGDGVMAGALGVDFAVLTVPNVALAVDELPKPTLVEPKAKAGAGVAGCVALSEVVVVLNVKPVALGAAAELAVGAAPLPVVAALFASVLIGFVEPKAKAVLLVGAVKVLEEVPKENSDAVRRREL